MRRLGFEKSFLFLEKEQNEKIKILIVKPFFYFE